jgi:D-sedoheptulose 7-phosphate isomerase
MTSESYKHNIFEIYINNLIVAQKTYLIPAADKLTNLMFDAWQNDRTVYLCGNGGSGANALHMANDLMLFGQKEKIKGVKTEALNANVAVVTCIANDVSFEDIFVNQLKTKLNKNDILLVLSGSGNSKNIINAIEFANSIDALSVGVLGFDGGKAKGLVKELIHFAVDDMQVVEDLQISLVHMLMKQLALLTSKVNLA